MEPSGKDIKFAGTIPAIYEERLGPVIFAPYADDLAKRIAGEVSSGKLLEVACGTGVLTRRLDAALPRDVRITATDLNQAMLAYGKEKGAVSSRVQWQQADAAKLPFESGSFDAVACQFGFMFVPDKAAAFREARRVLRDGCPLLFNVWSRIEENAFARVAHETITRFFKGSPPTFYQLPFGFHDAAIISGLLAGARFTDVTLQGVEFDSVAPSVGEFARGLVEGNPIANAIRDEGLEFAPIVDAVKAELTKVGGAAPFRSPMRALVVLARAEAFT